MSDIKPRARILEHVGDFRLLAVPFDYVRIDKKSYYVWQLVFEKVIQNNMGENVFVEVCRDSSPLGEDNGLELPHLIIWKFLRAKYESALFQLK